VKLLCVSYEVVTDFSGIQLCYAGELDE